MTNTPCEVERDRIQELVDGLLSPGLAAGLEQHIAGCAGCRGYHALVARTADELDHLLARPGQAPDLLAALGLAEPVVAAKVVPFAPRRAWRTAWGAVAACALVMVGVAGVHHTGQPVVAVASQPAVLELATTTAGASTLDESETILTWFGPEDGESDVIEE